MQLPDGCRLMLPGFDAAHDDRIYLFDIGALIALQQSDQDLTGHPALDLENGVTSGWVDVRPAKLAKIHRWQDRERTEGLYRGEADFPIADRVIEVAERLGCRPAQVSLAWLASRPGVVAPVVGVSRAPMSRRYSSRSFSNSFFLVFCDSRTDTFCWAAPTSRWRMFSFSLSSSSLISACFVSGAFSNAFCKSFWLRFRSDSASFRSF